MPLVGANELHCPWPYTNIQTLERALILATVTALTPGMALTLSTAVPAAAAAAADVAGLSV